MATREQEQQEQARKEQERKQREQAERQRQSGDEDSDKPTTTRQPPKPPQSAQGQGDQTVHRVAIVPDPNKPGISTFGPILTPGQLAGLDPIDAKRHEKQSQPEERQRLTNTQTDHERENALDPLSSGPSPAVREDAPLTSKQYNPTVTDMSGRPALPTLEDKIAMPKVREALQEAQSKDDEDDTIPDDQKGWRTPAQMGIPGAAIKRMVNGGAPLESATMPNGHFFPESGTRYRLKGKGGNNSEASSTR